MSASDHLGQQWKQPPLIMTPGELKSHVQDVIKNSPHKTSMEKIQSSPSGRCYDATCLIHGSMPHGSHVAVYGGKHHDPESTRSADWYSNHFVHHVPTTEGMYAVDLTHRQFVKKSDRPLVEPLEKFQDRRSIKKFRTLRTDPEHAKLYTEGRKVGPMGKKVARQLKKDVK